MLTENEIFFKSRENEDRYLLVDTRKSDGNYKLTPEKIDYEMQTGKSTTTLELRGLTQKGLEHFVSKYGSTYKTLYLNICVNIKEFSPLAELENLEALCIEWCRNVDKLWDFSKNKSLKILSVRDSRKITANPMLLKTSKTLEEIRLWGGDLDSKYTLDSLSCFEGMKTLKRIDLNNIKLFNRNFDVLSTLPNLEEFNFDAGMLTTEEIAFICAKYPYIKGDCLRAYTKNEPTCIKGVRICGNRKPSLYLPEDQARLDKYVAEFNSLVEKFKKQQF